MDNRSPYSNSICTHGSLFYWGLFQEKFQAPPPDKAGRPSKDRASHLSPDSSYGSVGSLGIFKGDSFPKLP